jgi:hypothetical protein
MLAGDLPAALRAGLRALERAQGDAVQPGACRAGREPAPGRARAPRRGRAAAGARARHDRGRGPSDLGSGLARHDAEARELEALEQRSLTALVRARVLGGAGLGLFVLALGLLALRTPPAAASPIEQ